MAPLSIMAASINILTKSFGLLSTASLARCTCAITAATPFSTTSDGRPKRPTTSYARYVKEQMPRVKQMYPGFKMLEATKKIAERWNELSPNQKRPFEEAYRSELIQYKKTMAQLTPEQSAAIKEEMRQKMAKRKSIRKHRELNSLGKPKGHRSGFNIFMSEHYERARGATSPEKMASLVKDWKNLNDSQKQAYVQLSQDDKVRYLNELKIWEKHMAEIGRYDLIRLKNKPRKTGSKDTK
ncbi:transcription factor A, mitochondrial [Sardina pilchardus]|uniref:transcription factor A, mitochondrial n=1 Tax=Sardina pilchardus TaxID=27697 RepID=UPI002E106F61